MSEFRVRPEAGQDREVVEAAVRAVIRQRDERVRPAVWRLTGWVQARTGITDLRDGLDSKRAWVLSARLPWGGRGNSNLTGRGDAR